MPDVKGRNFGYLGKDRGSASSYKGYRAVPWNPVARRSIESSGSPTAHNPHGGGGYKSERPRKKRGA